MSRDSELILVNFSSINCLFDSLTTTGSNGVQRRSTLFHALNIFVAEYRHHLSENLFSTLHADKVIYLPPELFDHLKIVTASNFDLLQCRFFNNNHNKNL